MKSCEGCKHYDELTPRKYPCDECTRAMTDRYEATEKTCEDCEQSFDVSEYADSRCPHCGSVGRAE